MKVLVVDIGGTHIKIASSDHPVPIKVPSGPDLTPERMVDAVLQVVSGWEYEVITVGYPGPVRNDHPATEPHNLGSGWVPFDFRSRFNRPVRFLNDAAMQALGGYEGGKMLFLGVGTGLGSALIVNGLVIPMELAHLPYRKGKTYEEYIGLVGLQRRGKRRWRKSVIDVTARLGAAFVADYVLLGGGNAKLMKELPENVRQGANANAIAGGIALWKSSVESQEPELAHEGEVRQVKGPAPEAGAQDGMKDAVRRRRAGVRDRSKRKARNR